MDAEGSEPAVLAGAARLLATSPPEALLIEINYRGLARRGSTPTAVFSTLADAGYTVHSLGLNGRLGAPPSLGAVERAARRLGGVRSRFSALRTPIDERQMLFNVVAVFRGSTTTRAIGTA